MRERRTRRARPVDPLARLFLEVSGAPPDDTSLLRMRRVSQNIGKSSEGRTLNMTKEMQMIFFLAGIIFVFATCYSPLMVGV